MEDKDNFNPSKQFKSLVLLTCEGRQPIKMIINKYADSTLIVLTQRNKFGSFVRKIFSEKIFRNFF